MKKEAKLICFIDDDPAEVEAFKSVFSNDFIVLADTTPQPVIDQVKKRRTRPNLFVLDLYFPKGRKSSDGERNRMVELKEEVDKAQKRLSDYLSQIGQSRDGGIELMRYVQKKYPGTPIVFYTRKGTLDDGAFCIDKGADCVLPKAATGRCENAEDRLRKFEQAAQEQHDWLVTKFFCLASTSSMLKKIIRLCRHVWNIWKKL